MLIAGDIGGTKTLLALYEPGTGARKPLAQAEFHSADFSSLEEIVVAFTVGLKRPVRAACFDVAGPVVGGRTHLTNLPWVLDETSMQQALGLERVMLLNDLKAVAYAVPHLLSDEVQTINEGEAEPHGPIGVVAPGTGLGEAFLVWNGSAYIACSSEGGHSDFGPANVEQAALWKFVADRFGHVANERVCSGSGLPNIYDFLRDSGRVPEAPALKAQLASAVDRTPMIVQAAVREPVDALCQASVDLFISILAAEAGNLALTVLATGGIFLGGGIPSRILQRIDPTRFMRDFASKGRLGGLLQKIPVKVITTQAALLGAALYGLDQMSSSG